MPRLLPALLLAVAVFAGGAEGADAPLDGKRFSCAGPCTLHLLKLGTGAGTVRSADGALVCGSTCDIGTDYDVWVTLHAAPSPGSVFTGWVGDCQPASGTECRVHMVYGPVTYFAVFDRVGDSPTPLEEPSSGTVPRPAAPPPPAPAPSSPPEAAKYGGCTHFGTTGPDELNGSSGRDVFCGFGGNDHIHGGGGNDVVFAGAGNDVIEVHRGADRVDGGAGADTTHGGSGNDVLIGGAGRDRIYGEDGRDELAARDRSRDFLHGGAGRDTARADGRDRLRAVERRL